MNIGNRVIGRIGPSLLKHPRLLQFALKVYASLRGMHVEFAPEEIRIRRHQTHILLRPDMSPYVRDFVDDFSSYANAVEASSNDQGLTILDFRYPADFHLRGWDVFEVRLPGVPEPMETVEQYISLTLMKKGMHVLDLGAYAGISALAFLEVVGTTGRVVAVEADPGNAVCTRTNFQRYREIRGNGPELLEAAVWSTSGTLEFVAENSLGSAPAEVLTRAVEPGIQVRAVTLSEIVEMFSLTRLDIIKADIEGAEFAAFSDTKFFEKFHPTIIFEPAMNSLNQTSIGMLTNLFEEYGYRVQLYPQAGSRLPLLVCQYEPQ